MPGRRAYYVYILTNHSRTLYTGVTNDLIRRVDQHRRHLGPGFTSRYRIDQLVFYEAFDAAWQAIGREKQIKGWTRARKIALIESMNPAWEELSGTLHDEPADLLSDPGA